MKQALVQILTIFLLLVAQGAFASSTGRSQSITVHISVMLLDEIVPARQEIRTCANRIEQRAAWKCRSKYSDLRVVRKDNQSLVVIAPI